MSEANWLIELLAAHCETRAAINLRLRGWAQLELTRVPAFGCDVVELGLLSEGKRVVDGVRIQDSTDLVLAAAKELGWGVKWR